MPNYIDPEGNTQSVTPQSVTVPGQYTFTLASNGAFVFTPDATFTGPVSFVYTTCDDGTPSECSDATLYFLVTPAGFPLPIHLVSFNVVSQNCQSVIKWTVGTAKDISQFVVEHSLDGKAWIKFIKLIIQKGLLIWNLSTCSLLLAKTFTGFVW